MAPNNSAALSYKPEAYIVGMEEFMSTKDHKKNEYNLFKTTKNSSSAVYGLGFIGALIYFLGHAESFWLGVLGIFQAIVWPAILVFKLLEFVFS